MELEGKRGREEGIHREWEVERDEVTREIWRECVYVLGYDKEIKKEIWREGRRDGEREAYSNIVGGWIYVCVCVGKKWRERKEEGGCERVERWRERGM